MANAHDLGSMTPAGLHALGIETLSMSLGTGDGDLARATARATQAMALFFAAMSADDLAEPAGSHRASSLDREGGRRLRQAMEDGTLGERVRDG
jgi:hypothetical protein